MPTFDELLSNQIKTISAIHRLISNFKKLGKVNMTYGAVIGRVELLNKYWQSCQELDNQLTHQANADESRLDYFKDNQFEKAEIAYLDALTQLYDMRETLRSTASSKLQESTSTTARLPQIDLPKFSGNYLEWEQFRDLFDSLINQQSYLTKVQKLHYLISSLEGEASQLLKNIRITEANYDSAWHMLKQRYDNRRLIIMSHLQTLMNVAPAINESSSELRRVRDQITESVSALKNLGRSVDEWDDILVYLLLQKLDSNSRKAWEISIEASVDFPTFTALKDFLEHRTRALESIQVVSTISSQDSKQSATRNLRNTAIASHLTTDAKSCIYCSKKHLLSYCPDFRRQSVASKQQFVKSKQCCFNCLRTGHTVYQCPSEKRCVQCQRKHHSYLHQASQSNSTPVPTATSTSSNTTAAPVASSPSVDDQASTVALHAAPSSLPQRRKVLLATALVRLRSIKGRSVCVRALLDQGSESSFVTEAVVQCLRAPRQRTHVTVSGIGGHRMDVIRSIASLIIEPLKSSAPSLSMDAYVLPRLTTYTAQQEDLVDHLPFFQGFQLADPDLGRSHKIELVIGADIYASILLDGVRHTSANGPAAQNTIFGWILSGPLPSVTSPSGAQSITVHHCVPLNDLNETIQKFWELEGLPQDTNLSPEDECCEQHFIYTHTRGSDGRYIVRFPWKQPGPVDVVENLLPATTLLHKLQCKLSTDPTHATLYANFMREYENLGHMECIKKENETCNSPVTYLPHHGVFKETSKTTRLRVVFNASYRSANGKSLNDNLLAGPKLQPDLIVILSRWRLHKIAFIADVEKMYRQIWMHPEDAEFQRILWSPSQDETVHKYRLLTVTYGTKSAPFLALRVLRQLAVDEKERFSDASQMLLNDFYVDDLISGASDITSAITRRQEIIKLLELGGFHLRKWASNDVNTLTDLQPDHCASEDFHQLQDDEQIRVLGLMWNHKQDVFQFNVSCPPVNQWTKRSILATTAKLFDPFGWLSPVVIAAKILLQELWIRRLDWDDPIPTDLENWWHTYCTELTELETISIPRYIGQPENSTSYELHGFSDASTRAYAAVVYLRAIKEDSVRISLLISKTKVAPVKQISVPRLELCAAHLLAKLLNFTMTSMKFENIPAYTWTDSAVVLTWLRSHSSRWQTFVANRVADIQTRLPTATWNHVPSNDNPADCASRGVSASQLAVHHLWWTGPPWLSKCRDRWPQPRCFDLHENVLEVRENQHFHHAVVTVVEWDLLHRYSSWSKLLRITAYCLKFVRKLRQPKSKRVATPLSSADIDQARKFWLKHVQALWFKEEIAALRAKSCLVRRSSLNKLQPFLDDVDLIRLGGRLRHASICYDERHPIVIPRHSRIAELIVRHFHQVALHGGPQLTLRIIRQQYWILGGRQLVRSVIHRCVPCIRERAQPSTQVMGDLPASRIQQSRPFPHTGVDYAGPILVRMSKGRGCKTHKAYVVLFVCFSVRAIHLELVSDYTSAAFVAAFRRFVSRRGLPSDLYSDNGTTFQGADAELRQAFRSVTKDTKLITQFASDGITWHFLPPAAPHFGGLWEAGVKSMKHHLRRVVGSHTLTFEEMTTVLTQIEACLNSRPLGPLNDDPMDTVALTPGHFIIGSPLVAVPTPSVLHLEENRLSRWQLVHQITQNFWKRWQSEYLHCLQQRTKWSMLKPNLVQNELVLVRNELQPPTKWPLGRVIELHAGADGHIRVVTVRTATTTLKRPISKICRLQITATDNSVNEDSSRRAVQQEI